MVILVAVLILGYVLFTQGLGSAILLFINVAWFGCAYLGHLNYPPISPGEAIFWTILWSPGGIFKFLSNRGKE